jgi:hypothetical protein
MNYDASGKYIKLSGNMNQQQAPVDTNKFRGSINVR